MCFFSNESHCKATETKWINRTERSWRQRNAMNLSSLTTQTLSDSASALGSRVDMLVDWKLDTNPMNETNGNEWRWVTLVLPRSSVALQFPSCFSQFDPVLLFGCYVLDFQFLPCQQRFLKRQQTKTMCMERHLLTRFFPRLLLHRLIVWLMNSFVESFVQELVCLCILFYPWFAKETTTEKKRFGFDLIWFDLIWFDSIWFECTSWV